METSTPITDWESRSCTSRGKALTEAINRAGMLILNRGSTYVRRGVSTAIYLPLTTEQCSYAWATAPDTWGSDHFPIVINPVSGSRPRSRTYHVTDWSLFRKHCGEMVDGCDFFSAIAKCAQVATVQSSAQPHTLAPDLYLLNLRASRRRTERRAIRTGKVEHWTNEWMPAADGRPATGGARVGAASVPPSRTGSRAPWPGDF